MAVVELDAVVQVIPRASEEKASQPAAGAPGTRGTIANGHNMTLWYTDTLSKLIIYLFFRKVR